MSAFRQITVLVFGALLLACGPAFAEKRVALVIGNSTYRYIPSLDNPRNDAVLMAKTLRDLGFTLVGGDARLDLDKAGLDRAVQSFGNELQGADIGLFYYAGHGVQVRGANYLVPVEANPTKEADVDFQMLDTTAVLRQMESADTKLNLIVLDACRNNPFAGRGLRGSEPGLAQMRAPQGTLISFATQPGNVAQDGTKNSPYTAALAQTIRQPGLDIFQTFNQVGLTVIKTTAGAQQPWLSASPISGSFFFAGLPVTKSAPLTQTEDEARIAELERKRAAILAAMPRLKIDAPKMIGSINLKGARIDDLRAVKTPSYLAFLSPSLSPDPIYAELGWLVSPKGPQVKLPDQNSVWHSQGGNSLSLTSPAILIFDNGEGLQIRRTIFVDDNFLMTIGDEVTNNGNQPITLFPYALISRHVKMDRVAEVSAGESFRTVVDGKLQQITYGELDNHAVRFSTIDAWIGISGRERAVSLIPDPKEPIQIRFSATADGSLMLIQADFLGAARTIEPGSIARSSARLFVGSNDTKAVSSSYENALGIKYLGKLFD